MGSIDIIKPRTFFLFEKLSLFGHKLVTILPGLTKRSHFQYRNLRKKIMSIEKTFLKLFFIKKTWPSKMLSIKHVKNTKVFMIESHHQVENNFSHTS